MNQLLLPKIFHLRFYNTCYSLKKEEPKPLTSKHICAIFMLISKRVLGLHTSRSADVQGIYKYRQPCNIPVIKWKTNTCIIPLDMKVAITAIIYLSREVCAPHAIGS